MTDTAGETFEVMLNGGLTAYTVFHGHLTDPTLRAELSARFPDADTSAVGTLPVPSRALPLRALASLAHAAATGPLEFHYAIDEQRAPGIGLLREWRSGHRTALERLIPEAFSGRELWLGWSPPPPESLPYGPNRIDWGRLMDLAREFLDARRPEVEALTDPAELMPACLFVLLRDWYVDLEPLLASSGVDRSALVERAFDRAESREPVADVRRTEMELRAEHGLPTSAWTILGAFARAGVLAELDPRLTEEAVTASWPAPTQRGDDGPAAPTALPSTAIASDAWTTDDTLGYELYADAIARFVVDRRTRAPLTIGVKAPWGAGKTSLMRMIRRRLDPDAPSGRGQPPAGADDARLSNREVLRATRRSREQAVQELDAPARLAIDAKRTTVWFNAWKYQSGEQLWAGLAHAIVSQVEERMTVGERERFWASLNIRRVDLSAVRRRIYRAFLLRVLPNVLALPFVALAAVVLWLVSSTVGQVAAVAGPALVGADAVRRWLAVAGEDVASADPSLVRDPGYEGQLGFLHLVHEDMHRVLGLVATPERPLVVFIDDLDRCSYKTVADVIEALNAFLAGDFENCVFVIAMEPDLVAAQIHVAYEALFDRMAKQDGAAAGDLGWRFLEKMVQLPLALPPPRQPELHDFVNALVGAAVERRTVELADDSAEVARARGALREARGGDRSLDGIADAMARAQRSSDDDASPAAVAEQAALRQAARIEYAAEFDDQHDDVREMLLRHVEALDCNPREVKRFLNVFRFYAYVQFWRRSAGLPAPDLDGAAKLATLAVRCPQLLSALGATVELRDGARSALEWLERDGDEHAEALVLNAVPRRVRDQLLTTPRLLALIRRGPPVGADAAGFL